MSLFSSKEILDAEEPKGAQPGAIRDDGIERTVFFSHSDVIADVLGTIKQKEVIHLVSAGAWSTHELLMYLLGITGPARVLIATWTMTETPARSILDAMQAGLITDMKCIMDVRMEKKPAVLQLAKFNMSQVRLSQSHAKVFVIQNDEWGISVSGSMNFTENPRIEQGVISTNKAIAEFHSHWMHHEMEVGYKVE